MMKDENFIAVQGWMINRLKLRGNELLVYAVIYGFSQDGESWFKGSAQYIADWCGSSRPVIMENLKRLVEKKMLEKIDVIKNNVKYCNYKALNPLKESYLPCQESLQPLSGIMTPLCKESLHHNISSQDRQNINTRSEIKNEELFLIFYQNYPKKTDKTDAKKVFVSVIKKGMTLEEILKRLELYKEKLRKDRTETKYIRNPARFLRTLEDYEEEPISKLSYPEERINACPKCGGQILASVCMKCDTAFDGDGKELK